MASRDDFLPLASLGRPVPKGAPDQVRRKWSAISAFTTIDLARTRARERGLGGWWAQLELPAEVVVEEDPPNRLGRHVSVYGTTPEQLLGYIVDTGSFEPDEGV